MCFNVAPFPLSWCRLAGRGAAPRGVIRQGRWKSGMEADAVAKWSWGRGPLSPTDFGSAPCSGRKPTLTQQAEQAASWALDPSDGHPDSGEWQRMNNRRRLPNWCYYTCISSPFIMTGHLNPADPLLSAAVVAPAVIPAAVSTSRWHTLILVGAVHFSLELRAQAMSVLGRGRVVILSRPPCLLLWTMLSSFRLFSLSGQSAGTS